MLHRYFKSCPTPWNCIIRRNKGSIEHVVLQVKLSLLLLWAMCYHLLQWGSITPARAALVSSEVGSSSSVPRPSLITPWILLACVWGSSRLKPEDRMQLLHRMTWPFTHLPFLSVSTFRLQVSVLEWSGFISGFLCYHVTCHWVVPEGLGSHGSLHVCCPPICSVAIPWGFHQSLWPFNLSL